MAVKPLMLHLHPDKNWFEECVQDLNKDHPLGFMLQETIAEAKAILTKFLNKFSETNENLTQHDHGLIIEVGQHFVCYSFVIVKVG